jgi:hypothetical protein
VRRLFGALGAALAVAGCTAAPQSGGANSSDPSTTSTPRALLVAAGDIACEPGERPSRDECGQQVTADLVTGLNPNAVLALGDTQYEDGTPDEFAAYDESWGRFKDITLPVVGNHEYQTPDAKGYYAYFGDRAGEPGKGWYTTTVGTWRVIVLNSECAEIGGCEPDSEQGRWLSSQLGGLPRCTLAAFHRPRFSSGDEHGDNPELASLWSQLQKAGVDVVLNGHDHDYERFAPQDADGDPADGPVEFVVGTGGRSLRGFSHTSGRSSVRWSDSFGVLAMTLRADGYDWRFVGPSGAPAVDSGTGTCREQ